MRNLDTLAPSKIDMEAKKLSECGEWMTPKDLAQVFSLSPSTAWRVCNELPHLRIRKRCIRVARKDVIDAMREGRL